MIRGASTAAATFQVQASMEALTALPTPAVEAATVVEVVMAAVVMAEVVEGEAAVAANVLRLNS